MTCDRISFEVYNMNLKKNKALIHHIYDESHVKDKIELSAHPLEVICDAAMLSYHIDVQTTINKVDARVRLTFDKHYDQSKKKLVCNRLQQAMEHVLGAKIVRIYEKLQ